MIKFNSATNYIAKPNDPIDICTDPEPIRYGTTEYILAQCHCTDAKPGIALHLPKKYIHPTHLTINYRCYTCGFEGCVFCGGGMSGGAHDKLTDNMIFKAKSQMASYH